MICRFTFFSNNHTAYQPHFFRMMNSGVKTARYLAGKEADLPSAFSAGVLSLGSCFFGFRFLVPKWIFA